MHPLIITILFASPPTLPPERSRNMEDPSEASDATSEPSDETPEDRKERVVKARRLYDEGTVLYESADYEGAIGNFTRALTLAHDQETSVRQALLYNIATAHEKQFTVDRDVVHLRQALTLYRRYRTAARKEGWTNDEFDVEARILKLEGKLRAHEQMTEARERRPALSPTPPSPPKGPVDSVAWKKPRNAGIGLVVVGGAAVVGGTVLAVLGSRVEADARAEVDGLADLGVPPDHPAWAEGDQFIAQERRRGNAMLGAGVTVSVVGAVGVGLGTYYLVRAKKMREKRLSAAPTWGPRFGGVQLSGKF